MPAIHIFYEDVSFRLKLIRNKKSWIKKVIEAEHKKLGVLNYIFCSDALLLKMNLEYLGHNTLTDIITFNNSQEETLIEGDIYISIERVRENAHKFASGFENELHRVMIHGVLHLLGYSDKTRAQKLAMRKKEDECLALGTKLH
ncbi:rRNA maturation RNase YbeY [Chryseolinea sp. H1M3-3]|uniref:rRNA maturation RNase YbeY n=1 Tax=Chryseolinea sp. H1M3-3 TaxID=3034144 RepID=UPI0023ED95C0|nr:rRNA maturation RNase YbeY [Chryseolinea sp. H1M3-3]